MFKAASMAYYEPVWLWKLFSEPFEHVLETIIVDCDNQSGILLSENPCSMTAPSILTSGTTDMVQQGAIKLHHFRTDEQVTDILTKPFGKVKFIFLQREARIHGTTLL